MDKTHAFISEKMPKTHEIVKELYFSLITHPSNLVTLRITQF